jgi:hypothetical protein
VLSTPAFLCIDAGDRCFKKKSELRTKFGPPFIPPTRNKLIWEDVHTLPRNTATKVGVSELTLNLLDLNEKFSNSSVKLVKPSQPLVVNLVKLSCRDNVFKPLWRRIFISRLEKKIKDPLEGLA